MEMHAKIQKWFDSVLVDNLENVAKEVKGLEDSILDLKSNKMVFRILLCLSHTAERTSPTQIRTGMEIFNITDSLCYSLREIPDLLKYFSSLYHITKKLIAMRLYSEAMTVTAWCFPGNLVRDLNQQHSNMYSKIASLWRGAANALIQSSHGSLTFADHKVLVELVKNEFEVLEVIAKERPAFVFSRILCYLIELEAVPVAPECKGIRGYRDIAKRFLGQIDVSSVIEQKYDMYVDALRFVNSAPIALCSESSIENTLTAFTKGCSMIETVLKTDLELDSTFSIYKNMGIMLLKPIGNSDKMQHWDLKEIRKRTLYIIQAFENSKGVSWNMRMIALILQPLIAQWEQLISAADPEFLNAAVLRDILGLVKFMFSVLNSTRSSNCEVCQDNTCQMKKNIYSITVIGSKCLVMLSKLPANDLLRNIFPLIREVLEETVAAIFEMKESRCSRWSNLWSNCGINIYNLSVACHKEFYEESTFLFSLLCSCIVKFDGLDILEKVLGVRNPLAFVLYRLSGIHFNHGKYREALTPCALNGLLSYEDPDSKAFHRWAGIKHSAASSSDILNKTMLSILKEDMIVISEIGIDVKLEDYDLIKLCLREMRGLNEARSNLFTDMCRVLDELEALNCGDLEYAKGVHLVGYHRMNHLCNQMVYDHDFENYMTRANLMLNNKKSQSDIRHVIKGNMAFYNFSEKQYACAGETQNQIKLGNFGLPTSKQAYHEGEMKSAENLFPLTNINIRTEFKIFVELENALDHWDRGIARNIAHDDEWYWFLTLGILIVAGEYTRLHKIPHIETKVWSLAYKLAYKLNNVQARLHVVGRSLSLWNINTEWIEATNELVAMWEVSGEFEKENAAAFYLINVSNFYYEIGKHEEAGKTLKRALALPVVSPLQSIVPYLSSVDTIIRNHHFYSTEDRTTKFMAYVVHCLYAMIAVMDTPPPAKHRSKEKYLCGTEILMRCTANMSLRMNSIFSFKEITSHLLIRMKFAQNWGLTLCVAECLKNLCLIDLSRMQLENCLVKLQGLEYILQADGPKKSCKENQPLETIYTNQLSKPGCRDPRSNDASPVLRKKTYKQPEFMTHNHGSPCSCYKCKNVRYQYLVLSSIHVRAKLFFFEGWLSEALSYFSGAFSLQRKLLQQNSRQHVIRQSRTEMKSQPWNCFYNAVEYALLLIDFSRCIRELRTGYDQAEIKVAMAAVNVCEKFHLQSHPIYISARELVLEYQFCHLFSEHTSFDKFTVPDPHEIKITKFIFGRNKIDYSAVSTPSLKPCDKKPKAMKRVKTPPLLQLTKVSIDLSEDEEEFESPKSSRYTHKTPHNYITQKSLKKKNLEKYLDAAPEPCAAQTDATSTSANTAMNKVQKTVMEIESMAGSLFPNLSKQINEIADEVGSSDLEKMLRITELVEQLKGRSEHGVETSGFQHTPSSENSVEKPCSLGKVPDEVIDKLVTYFEEMLIRKNDESDILSTNNSAPQSDIRESTTLSTITKIKFDFCTEKKYSSMIVSSNDEYLNLDEKFNTIPDFLNQCKTFVSHPDHRDMKLEKPITAGHEQRLHTSARIKTSVTRTEKTDQKNCAGDSDVDLSSNETGEGKKEHRKRVGQKGKLKKSTRMKSKALQGGSNRDSSSDSEGTKKSKSTLTGPSVFEVKETSQFNESDLVPTSDIEEIAVKEKRKNDTIQKSKIPTSSRVLRSRSNGTSASTKNAKNSNRLQCSDSEKSKSTLIDPSVFKGKETLQINESDIVPTSDVDEIGVKEERKNDTVQKSKISTSSKVLRSRSRPTLQSTKNANNSNRIQSSDSEKSLETATDENTEQKIKSKVLTTTQKSSKKSDTLSVPCNSLTNQEDQRKINKRSTSGRTKRQR